MQGGIRNIESLKTWFFDVGKPFFTLSYLGGNANQVIMRNTATDNMEEAWDLLKRQVLAQSEVGRATLYLFVYKNGNANNPDGRTNIDITPGGMQPNGVAGFGSLPVGYVDENKINGMISAAREKWELEKRLEDLEAQINSPNDWVDKAISGLERIGETQLGQMLAMKLLGITAPPVVPGARPVNGTPEQPGESADDTFEDDIEATANMLGCDDITLARKLRQLVQNNPEMAKQLLQ